MAGSQRKKEGLKVRKLIAVLTALVMMLSAAGGLGEAGAELGSGKMPEAGAVIQGFEVVEKRDFRMAGAELVLFEHQKTGAKVMYIANEDTNRAFQLTFLTRPLDDTRLPMCLSTPRCTAARNNGDDRYSGESSFSPEDRTEGVCA